jgi:hypothetical protein
LFLSFVCRIPCRIFCSGAWCSYIVLIFVYCGRLIFLHQFWMILLLGIVSLQCSKYLTSCPSCF